MAWLFERTIELAAWVAMILGVICLVDAGYLFVQGTIMWRDGSEEAVAMLIKSGQAAAAFVFLTLAMGALACIDRYVFDLPQSQQK